MKNKIIFRHSRYQRWIDVYINEPVYRNRIGHIFLNSYKKIYHLTLDGMYLHEKDQFRYYTHSVFSKNFNSLVELEKHIKNILKPKEERKVFHFKAHKRYKGR